MLTNNRDHRREKSQATDCEWASHTVDVLYARVDMAINELRSMGCITLMAPRKDWRFSCKNEEWLNRKQQRVRNECILSNCYSRNERIFQRIGGSVWRHFSFFFQPFNQEYLYLYYRHMFRVSVGREILLVLILYTYIYYTYILYNNLQKFRSNCKLLLWVWNSRDNFRATITIKS